MWHKTENFEKWADGFAKQLVAETFRHIEGQTDLNSSAKHYVYSVFLARYIGAFLYRVMHEKPTTDKKLTKEERSKFVINNTAAVKSQIQDAVATGFQDAMTAFSGYPCDYFCSIKMVPPIPTNTKPC